MIIPTMLKTFRSTPLIPDLSPELQIPVDILLSLPTQALVKDITIQGTYLDSRSVYRPILDFSSGHDLTVHESEPC